MRLTETRPILRLDLEGKLIDEYPSIAEAEKHTGLYIKVYAAVLPEGS